MQSKRARLDRFISEKLRINRGEVKLLLAQGRIQVDSAPATDVWQLIDEFTQVVCDGETLQNKQPQYLMLHKPAGVVSATKDDKHTTVIDLLEREDRQTLHIVGRLDFNSSGLMLLTNDGRWSRALTLPEAKVRKHYRVTLADPIDASYINVFAEGMYFAYENILTRPALLEIIDSHTADVYLTEGRYHQIKRMFGRFNNEVLTLHRIAIGNVTLDQTLVAGAHRELTRDEVAHINTIKTETGEKGLIRARLSND